MEIRRQGPCPARKEACKKPCSIARSFAEAEAAMRNILKTVSLKAICDEAEKSAMPGDAQRAKSFMQWLGDNVIQPAG